MEKEIIIFRTTISLPKHPFGQPIVTLNLFGQLIVYQNKENDQITVNQYRYIIIIPYRYKASS